MKKQRPPTYGLMAEFSTVEELVAAVRRAHAEGYRNMDTYSPFPLEGIDDELGEAFVHGVNGDGGRAEAVNFFVAR